MGNPYVGLGTGENTQGWPLWVAGVVCVIIAGVFVIARMIQRLRQDKLGADDWLLLASLSSSIVLSITEIEAVVNGYGAHYNTLSAAQAVIARKWFYGAQIAYKVVLALNKTSICYMYFRIFKISSSAFRKSCYALLAFIIISNTAFIIGTIFQCTPVSAFWDKSFKPVFCFNQIPWWISYAVLQIILDFLLLSLPVKEVLKLKMSTVDKIGLIIVFSTGLFVTFTSIYRATTLAASATNPDPTYGPIPGECSLTIIGPMLTINAATTWTVIEANSGIVAACLPLLRQPFLQVFRFFARITPGRKGTARSNSDDNGAGGANGSYEKKQRHGPVKIWGRSLFETTTTDTQIEHDEHYESQLRDSEETMAKKGGDIYVMSDVSVTSSPMAEVDLQHQHRPNRAFD